MMRSVLRRQSPRLQKPRRCTVESSRQKASLPPVKLSQRKARCPEEQYFGSRGLSAQGLARAKANDAAPTPSGSSPTGPQPSASSALPWPNKPTNGPKDRYLGLEILAKSRRTPTTNQPEQDPPTMPTLTN